MIAIARASFREVLNKRIVHLIGIVTVIYLVLFTLLTYFIFERMRNVGASSSIILNNAVGYSLLMGFYFSSLIVSFLTIMASIPSISSEIESGVIHAVITKPLKRWEYVLGKYLGLLALIAVYCTFLYSAVITVNVVMDLPPLNTIDIKIFISGLLLFILEPVAILSFCIFGSVSFKTVSNGVLVISVFTMGMIGGVMEQVGYAANIESLSNWGIVISLVSPFDSVYRKMIDVIYTNLKVARVHAGPLFLSNTVPSMWMIAYVCLFSITFVFLAVRKFAKKDIS